MFKFELGILAKDKSTGVEGTITGRAEYLQGKTKYFIEGNVDDQWTDEENVEAVL